MTWEPDGSGGACLASNQVHLRHGHIVVDLAGIGVASSSLRVVVGAIDVAPRTTVEGVLVQARRWCLGDVLPGSGPVTHRDGYSGGWRGLVNVSTIASTTHA